MTDNLDIWRAAQAMVKRYGEDASLEAAKRAYELLAAGDIEGQRTWLRIVRAVEELERQKPEPGEAVN